MISYVSVLGMSIFFGFFKGPLEWGKKRSTCGNRATRSPIPAKKPGQAPLPLQENRVNREKLTEEPTENAVKQDVDFVDFFEK